MSKRRPDTPRGVGWGAFLAMAHLYSAQQSKNWCVDLFFPPPADAGIHPTLFFVRLNKTTGPPLQGRPRAFKGLRPPKASKTFRGPPSLQDLKPSGTRQETSKPSGASEGGPGWAWGRPGLRLARPFLEQDTGFGII